MGIRVEETLDKELLEVGVHSSFRHLEPADACRLQGNIVIDFDAINPL